jgi:hypothetical protein
MKIDSPQKNAAASVPEDHLELHKVAFVLTRFSRLSLIVGRGFSKPVLFYRVWSHRSGQMMAESLYGTKKPSKVKDISSSTSMAFSSNLASLISSSSKIPATGRARPSKSKSDLFTAHNKNVKKRAAADLDDGEQKHKTRDNLGSVDSAMLHRSKRKMEEKTRLYNAMKRGEYIGRDDHGLVDFDRKWAEKEAQGADKDGEDSQGSDEDDSDETEEQMDYEDEFGRTRKGTRAEAAREARRRRIQANAVEEEERLSARPKAPTNVIYGDAVQTDAFNPDTVIADRMAELAKKRDKSVTPPPDTYYDASAEVRTKGTGFYVFSHDKEGRQQEMDALNQERERTEGIRREREEMKERRKREIEERRRLITEQRSKAQADKFLRCLEGGDEGQERENG